MFFGSNFGLLIFTLGAVALLPVLQGLWEVLTSWRLYFLIGLVWLCYVFRVTRLLENFIYT